MLLELLVLHHHCSTAPTVKLPVMGVAICVVEADPQDGCRADAAKDDWAPRYHRRGPTVARGTQPIPVLIYG